MAMTPEQSAAFYQEQAESYPASIAAAKERRDFCLLTQNQGLFVKCALTSGIMRWRHGLGGPRPMFGLAVEGSTGFLADAAAVDPSKAAWKHFPFELVDYLRLLLGEPIDGGFVAGCLGDSLPEKHEFENLHLADRFLDMAVLLKLVTGRPWPRWGELLGLRAAKRRTALVAETFGA